MADTTVFTTGQVLERGDLDIFLVDSSGNPTNAYEITYALYYVDPVTNAEVLIGTAMRIPMNPAVGEYFASLMIPNNATTGCYRIRWQFRETAGSPEEKVVQSFVVEGVSVLETNPYSECVQGLISKMRILTRDNNPDRNYRFRPPEGEGSIGCNNQVFGYIWTDEEFAQYLEMALWKWNLQPPRTDGYTSIEQVCQVRPSWQAALLWGSLVTAAQALAYNWVSDEFDYSIGGISLNIEKSSKYMDLKRNAEEQWDKLTEAKSRTEKYFRGLAQPRFGRGVRSAFGPYVGRGVLSPRSFLVAFFSIGSYSLLKGALYANHLSALLT